MNPLKSWILKKVFSDWIPFKWIDGNKKEISRFAMFASALVALLQLYFPGVYPILDQFPSVLSFLGSMLGIELATIHDEDKALKNYGK